jgi:hypothetical protein
MSATDVTRAACGVFVILRLRRQSRFAGPSTSSPTWQTRIGEVDAATEAQAVEKAAVEFKQYAPKLMAVRRGAVRSS